MITIYLDHNVIDEFDKGETTYLGPVLANKEYLPIISVASVDEIFRGGDLSKSMRNIDSLKQIGVKYIHSGPDESHMLINELDYKNMHQEWLKMQSDLAPLNDSHFLFVSGLFRENEPDTVQDMEQAIGGKIAWIKNNYDRFPNLQAKMDEVLRNPEEYKQRCRELISLRKWIPFVAKEINNMPETSVFWTCVEKLKNAPDATLQLVGNHIQNAIDDAKTIDDQLMIVFNWLNLFGYWPDDLTQIKRIRANFSDAQHATYGIACNAILTSDKRFAKRIAAAIVALKLTTEVGADANELLQRIAEKSGLQ